MLKTKRGFSLIELLIGLLVLAILLGLGVPSFMVWVQNTQIRSAADAVLNGMQLARSEAIRRNKIVTFTLSERSSWTVQQANPSVDIEKRIADEGSTNVGVTPTPGGAYALTFDPLGGRTDNPDGSAPIDNLDFKSLVSSDSAVRPLRIMVGVSGTVRLCDPDPKLGTGDPRRCTQG